MIITDKNSVGVVELALLWRVPVCGYDCGDGDGDGDAMAMASSMELEMEDVSSCCLPVAHCILDWDFKKKGC